MKICKDGRIWGQNNKEAGGHLGTLTGQRKYVKQGYNAQKRSEEKLGNKNPMYGVSLKGELNGSWKGGISSPRDKIRASVEGRLWREAVFARDNWTCQECGKQGGRLHAHHIKSFAEYPELRLAIDNAQTLCLKCHSLSNNYCGRKRNGKE